MPIVSLFSLTVNAFTYRHTKSVWWLKIICIVRKQSTEQYYYCNTTTRVYDERQLRFISEIKKFSMSNHCRSGFPLRAICVMVTSCLYPSFCMQLLQLVRNVATLHVQ